MKNNQGITLIALVVTIIVLLILAGVTISMVASNDGILNKAKNAVEVTNEAAIKEDVELAILEKILAYHNNYKNLSKIYSTEMDYVKAEFASGNAYSTNAGATLSCDNNGAITYTDKNGNKTVFQMSQDGTVEKVLWTQDKTNVTNGSVTLEVGTKINGYTANEISDWYVLGAEDGKLLITTNYNVTTVTLSGKDGYANGIATLNSKAEAYTNPDFAEGNARTIDVDDVNRVTGYVDNVYNAGEDKVDRTGNKVKYTFDDGFIYYQGDREGMYPPSKQKGDWKSTFTYWTGSAWDTLDDGESVSLTNDYYWYYPQTLTTDDSKKSEATINGIANSSDAYNLLFKDTSGADDKYYWLGSQCVLTFGGRADFDLRQVSEGEVSADGLFGALGSEVSHCCGLRPVVAIKSSIKVGSNGSLKK